jgi:hypothetical protein
MEDPETTGRLEMTNYGINGEKENWWQEATVPLKTGQTCSERSLHITVL